MPMTNKRTLPPLVELAGDIAHKLGGVARILSTEEHEQAAAIAFDDVHLLLVRDHGWTVTVSLPTKRSWSLQTDHHWKDAEPKIRRAVTSFRRIVTLSDVISTLRSAFPDLRPTFPGVPVPAEAWMRNDTASVGFFQQADGVRVVVWLDRDALEKTVEQRSDLDGLERWVGPALEKQRVARDAAAAEEKRRAALPPPTLETVLARLRKGERISTGGGRWFLTYFVEDGKLCREVFDEGAAYTEAATEADLAASIAANLDRFRE
jgi:hypothetical protein